MIRIEEICDKVKRNHPQADLNLLRRAYLFSAREHKGQKRASGEAYLVHPLEVANILADMRLDAVSVSTGLLHDVVEDTIVDTNTIREYFGDEVAQNVAAVIFGAGRTIVRFFRIARQIFQCAQRVFASLDGRPGARLWFSRSSKPLQEPIANAGMKRFQGNHKDSQCTMNETPC